LLACRRVPGARGIPKRLKIANRIWELLAIALVLALAWSLWIAPRRFTMKPYPAPHAIYHRLDGGVFRVSSARGHVLFLDFYASWCQPCRQELPNVEAFARAHPLAEVVPIDVGEPKVVVARFARELGLQGVAMDPQTLSRGFFGIEGFPTIVAVDPNGQVRAVWPGYNPSIESVLANALSALAT
jgi:thiol-disulfide isomerase/thioredoxin